MRKITPGSLFILSIVLSMFLSCKKESDNRRPTAVAGSDQVITLPTDSVLLDGSGSNDPDGKINGWLWSKISGPASFSFSNGSYYDYEPRTIVKDLFAGCYQFGLRVTDADRFISRDTVQVIVLAAYDLDINIEGTFSFSNNYFDGDGSYYDLVRINGIGSFASIGQFEFDLSDYSDSASTSNPAPSWARLEAKQSNYPFLYVPFIGGQCSVFFKQLIQSGGGPFNGTFKVSEGTALQCNKSFYTTLAPLTISGSLDTTAHTIRLNIRGKIFF